MVRSEAQLRWLREEFHKRAEVAFAQMCGHDEQNGLVTFTQREERVCASSDLCVTDRATPTGVPPEKAVRLVRKGLTV